MLATCAASIHKRRKDRPNRLSVIDDRLAVDAAQPPVALGVDGDLIMVLAAVGVGGQVLTTVLEPANGMATAKRETAKAGISSASRIAL